jgi:hypothetical protein
MVTSCMCATSFTWSWWRKCSGKNNRGLQPMQVLHCNEDGYRTLFVTESTRFWSDCDDIKLQRKSQMGRSVLLQTFKWVPYNLFLCSSSLVG